MNDTSGHSGNFPSSPNTSEEWPDWSEPEDPGDRTATAQVRPPEAPDAAGSPLPDLEVSAEKSPSSLGTERDSGGGVTAAVTSGEDLKPLESSRPQRTSPAPSLEDADQTKPPQVSSQERRLKVPSELGLGEEFTIQVKKKPVQDPELDWFADMTPEIKPSAVLLVAPALRAEAAGRSEDGPPAAVLFSAKFAAAETAEVRAPRGRQSHRPLRSTPRAVLPPRGRTDECTQRVHVVMVAYSGKKAVLLLSFLPQQCLG